VADDSVSVRPLLRDVNQQLKMGFLRMIRNDVGYVLQEDEMIVLEFPRALLAVLRGGLDHQNVA
jgi:hypothetical protein